MKHNGHITGVIAFVLGLVVAGSLPLYAEHDITCYEMIEPDSSTDYVEEGIAITPILGIANLGETSEQDFKVKFIAVNDENEEDTLYAESTKVDIGPYPDSIEVEFPDWIPEGYCDEEEPFLKYLLTGIAALDADEDSSNDTVENQVTSLWSHDAGVIDIYWPEEPPYLPGDVITVTATVENFGYHAEEDVEVHLEVRDVDSNDVLLWHNEQIIPFLNWRGNATGEPYTIDVTFPPFTFMSHHHHLLQVKGRTELIDDDCPEDDDEYRLIRPPSVGEDRNPACKFILEVEKTLGIEGSFIEFAVPYQSRVKLSVFDASGRWICSLANDVFSSGIHQKSWNGKDAAGRAVPSGTYVVRIEAEGFSAAKKIEVIR